LFLVFIGQRVFTRTAMQGERHHIGCCESGLWEVGQAEFVDHASALDTGTRFLLGSRMRRHHAPAALPRWPYLHVRAVVEGAHAVAFRAAELLIGRQVEAGLDLGPVEGVLQPAATPFISGVSQPSGLWAVAGLVSEFFGSIKAGQAQAKDLAAEHAQLADQIDEMSSTTTQSAWEIWLHWAKWR
jgi:hypothetical protein